MTCKITIHWESLVTLATLIWFLPSMCPQMSCKITIRWESLITVATLIWFVPSMHLKMFCNITILWESLVTMSALICFFPMCPQMCCKITLMWEILVTLATLMEFFSHFSVRRWLVRLISFERTNSDWLHIYGYWSISVSSLTINSISWILYWLLLDFYFFF